MLLKRFTLLLVLMAFPVFVLTCLAQPLPPGGVPIDGGAAVLLAACAAYGAKKLYEKRSVQ